MTFQLDLEDHHLENGLRLLAVENRAHPAVCIRLTALGGPAAEPCERAGVAELATRALLLRSQRFTPAALDDFLDLHGIALSRGVNRHACDLVLRCPSESLEPAMELLAELVRYPHCVDRELELMAHQVRNQIAQQALDPRGAATVRFRELAYPLSHPYARQPQGQSSTLHSLRADDVECFVRSQFQPGLTVLAVAGDMSFATLVDLTEQYFGDWRNDAPVAAVAVARPPRPPSIRDHIALSDSTQTELIVGGPTLGRAEPGYRALLLGTLILGQLGLSGRLGTRLREAEGLAYDCYASLEDVPVAALWTARASVHPSDVERAAYVILDEIRRLRTEPVAAADLAACKSACVGGMSLAVENNAGLASVLQTAALHQLEPDWPVRLCQEISQLTPHDIQRAAQAWLDEEHLLVVSAGAVTCCGPRGSMW